jgi:hypothetical protein
MRSLNVLLMALFASALALHLRIPKFMSSRETVISRVLRVGFEDRRDRMYGNSGSASVRLAHESSAN